MKNHTFELPCLDHRKSFHGKANVIEQPNDEKLLMSYETIVCGIDAQGNVKRYWDDFSTTTQRHVNSFLKFYGLDNLVGKANWMKMKVCKTENGIINSGF